MYPRIRTFDRKNVSRSLLQKEAFEIRFMDSDSWVEAEVNFLRREKLCRRYYLDYLENRAKSNDITWITWKTEQNLEIWPFFNSLLEIWVWENVQKLIRLPALLLLMMLLLNKHSWIKKNNLVIVYVSSRKLNVWFWHFIFHLKHVYYFDKTFWL